MEHVLLQDGGAPDPYDLDNAAVTGVPKMEKSRKEPGAQQDYRSLALDAQGKGQTRHPRDDCLQFMKLNKLLCCHHAAITMRSFESELRGVGKERSAILSCRVRVPRVKERYHMHGSSLDVRLTTMPQSDLVQQKRYPTAFIRP
jgi:hypothetical protein